jgi:hypothetical protein
MAKPKKTTNPKKPKATTRIQLVESESAAPTITARPGTSIEIVEVADARGKLTARRWGSRLCGYGSGYCLAIISTD